MYCYILNISTQIESKRIEKMYHANSNLKKACVVIRISDNVNFQVRSVLKTEWQFLKIKGSIQQEDTAMLNLYVHNNIVSNNVSRCKRTTR